MGPLALRRFKQPIGWSSLHASSNSSRGDTFMIDLHYWPTPNGWKISIMLEECGLPYKLVPVNIGTGEQFKPDFLKISPNNRMPAIVDHDPPGGGAPVSVFESGAILQYLAEKAGKFLPEGPARQVRGAAVGQLADGRARPDGGQANHFNMYAPQFNPPEAARATARTATATRSTACSACSTSGSADRPFVAGDYSIADMAIWPWVVGFKNFGQKLDDFPNLKKLVRGDDGQAAGRGEGQGGRRRAAPDAGHQHRRAAQDPVRPDGVRGALETCGHDGQDLRRDPHARAAAGTMRSRWKARTTGGRMPTS